MTPRGVPRDQKFTMVMTEDERSQLEQLAEADRRSAADWIRVAIATAHAGRFPVKQPKPTKK